MFGIVLIVAVTVMQLYVFWRSASAPFIKRFVPRPAFYGLGILLWAVFVWGRLNGHSGAGIQSGLIEFLGMNWLGAVFLMFTVVLAADAATAFGFILPGFAPSLRGYALAGGIALSLAAVVQGIRPPVIIDYEVRLPGLPNNLDGTVIIAMSDLHLGSQLDKEWMDERVKQVRAQRPDMIVLLGDIGEGHGGDQEGLLQALRKLSAPLGVWAVEGNHEYHGRRHGSSSLLDRSGFEVLHNRWAGIRPGLVLAGIDDLTARQRRGFKGDIVSDTLSGRPKGATIFLSHTPWGEEQAAKAGAGLMLCGHTHGGQIWPLSYLVKRRYPMIGGKYEINGTTVIVCRGTGTWGPRMRLWQPAEILRITLRTAQK